MTIKTHIEKNTFKDSVFLMRISTSLRDMDGVEGAEVIVGTDGNKQFLEGSGLLTEEIQQEAGPNDLIIAVKADSEDTAEQAINEAMSQLNQKGGSAGDLTGDYIPKTFDSALEQEPNANIGLISVPGEYVEREANKMLDAGLHTMIFSDNVPKDVEVSLKQKASQNGLLVMGPDCGTAIINGAPLAFANEVNRGNIGVVAAAGTGLQEVSTLIHNYGGGITQGIGTGGRDVKGDVGAITMIQGLKALEQDPDTEVIVIVSKPPEKSVATKVLEVAKEIEKPVVVNFVGGDEEEVTSYNCEPATTIKEAAEKAVNLSNGKSAEASVSELEQNQINNEKQKLSSDQKYIRGLYTGGTLAYETITVLENTLGGVYSNTPIDDEYMLEDSFQSVEHTVVDLGEDEFTQGKPHPMIDPSPRNERIVQEAKDPETKAILLDVVIGYGSHPDPAGASLKAIREAKQIAEQEGRYLPIIASVCGTDEDYQNYQEQVKQLEQEGVVVLSSNVEAVRFACELIN